MSTADTALSISINMAPGPEHRQEPVAPDKIDEGDRAVAATADVDAENVDTTTTSSSNNNNSNDSVAAVAVVEQSSNIENAPATNFATGADSANQSSPLNSGVDSKQEEPATLSELNDSELRALLDEAITYKCPKDREGKSHLFKELLQEAEADETKEGHRVICNSRCLPGSNRRRHKRDSVSERLTHGGSLQNLAHPIASEFDSSFAYPTSSSCHTYGSSRKKNKKYIGPSVSARQREGGSLPSDVDASHSLASLANLDLSFDKKKNFCVERSAYDWTNKEKSKSLDKPSYTSTKKEEKEKEKKESKRDTVSSSEIELETREKRIGKGKYGTNKMLESDNPPPESDYMVIDLGDIEVGAISERNVGSMASGIQRPRSLDTENDEGTEMRIIEPRKPIHYVTLATLDVDSPIEFPIRDHKQEKSKMSVNGTEVTGTLCQPHNSVKCSIGGASNSSSTSQSKIVPSLCSVMPSWQAQNLTLEGPRYTAQHITMKDPSVSGEKKSLDENGNAVQSYNDRFAKKLRRKHTQEHNVKVYNAENVEGHRNEDIDSLINFIENKESKSKKGKTSNPVRVKANSGTKPRTREKDTKREQLPSKLQKSNSLEEISKTKLEDLTTEKSVSSSGASSVSSQHGENVALRRPKQRSTGDATVDSRGDRRSWGTEEGQSIYCNDTGEDYTSRRNSNKKINPEPEHETAEFLVVTKKKKSKKQRRSSSGSRAQNLTTSGSYLQNSRGFSNEYRTPLSPELRRKSASSMPPSDKSDSSDLDSVHSLPVTSNSSKHNLTKVATSSGGTPQASYADIARMATISHNLNMSTIVPGMLNTTSWPSVPPKTPSEPDKVPQDYYPSLDEIQHSERKVRQQQNFAQSNHAAATLSLAFEKSLSPTLTKVKNLSDRKKAEAQEEAINKNIQVFKYVQDIEKMQSLTQQEQKHLTASNTYNTNTSETIATNTVTPRLNNNNTTMNYNPLDADNNSNCTVNNKDSVAHSRTNNPRSRRSYVHGNQNIQIQGLYEEQYVKKIAPPYHDEPIKKSHSIDTLQSENRTNPTIASHSDSADAQKLKTAKLTQESQDVESEPSNNKNKMTSSDPRTARIVKEYPNNNITMKHDVVKVGICQTQNPKQDTQQREDMENKKTKSQSDKDQPQRSSSVEMHQTKNSIPRPAVILLDETTSDIAKNNNLPTELTFGFEINEQLLLSEDNGNEETQATATSSSTFSPTVPPLVNKLSLNTFEKNPPLFTEKSARYDKFSSNYHMQSPNAHITPTNTHVTPVHPVMVQPLPYMSYPNTRFPPPTYLPPPPPPPPGIMEKFHPPKEDFAMLYVAPEEELNVQTYNHDKIVSFVGLAWDAVMRENVTATGRIQFYSGQ
ncbi:serine-rich adhesin for platelets isoform X4 [Polyergus mexicanus]|uniref:serine-rich adhesin for platelets isoform X4 n=1 Tax=Polyergus mexicanus TaxID=615972 RepID=UPI0038B5BB63